MFEIIKSLSNNNKVNITIIKIKNFKENKNRFNPNSKNNYFYLITPKGIALKTKLTINFMKKKMKEYDELKRELNSK